MVTAKLMAEAEGRARSISDQAHPRRPRRAVPARPGRVRRATRRASSRGTEAWAPRPSPNSRSRSPARTKRSPAPQTLVKLQAHDPETVAVWKRICRRHDGRVPQASAAACTPTSRPSASAGESSYAEELAGDRGGPRAAAASPSESDGALVVRSTSRDRRSRASSASRRRVSLRDHGHRRRSAGACRSSAPTGSSTPSDARQSLHFRQVFARGDQGRVRRPSPAPRTRRAPGARRLRQRPGRGRPALQDPLGREREARRTPRRRRSAARAAPSSRRRTPTSPRPTAAAGRRGRRRSPRSSTPTCPTTASRTTSSASTACWRSRATPARTCCTRCVRIRSILRKAGERAARRRMQAPRSSRRAGGEVARAAVAPLPRRRAKRRRGARAAPHVPVPVRPRAALQRVLPELPGAPGRGRGDHVVAPAAVRSDRRRVLADGMETLGLATVDRMSGGSPRVDPILEMEAAHRRRSPMCSRLISMISAVS